MDQLKLVGQFIVKHRFWFCLGLVLVFAAVTYPSGSQTLLIRANQRIQALNNAFTGVERFRNGSQHPNQTWIAAAEEAKSKLKTDLDSVWDQLYAAQEKHMTWPEEVSKDFAGRPFGAELVDRDKGNAFLLKYRRGFPDYVVDTFLSAQPLEYDEAGKIVGLVDVAPETLKHAVWTRTPVSAEAWGAQEEQWIQRSFLRAIASANKGAPSWGKAPVKRIFALDIGELGLDGKSKSLNPKLLGYDQPGAAPVAPGAAPGASPSGSRDSDQGVQRDRYLERTAQFRTVPVHVSLLVDQVKIPAILSALEASDFPFIVNQVNIETSPNEDLPAILRESGTLGERGGKNDPIFNSFRLDVWGVVRIYEMPPKRKADYEAKLKAAEAPATAPNGPAG